MSHPPIPTHKPVTHGTVFASTARTASPTPEEFAVSDSSGLVIVIDVTAVTSSPSVVFTIYGVDPASGQAWSILVSAAITGTGTTVLRISPHLTASTNVTAKDLVPHIVRVSPVHGNANSITYSVGVHLTK